jgi:hypothetical protein
LLLLGFVMFVLLAGWVVTYANHAQIKSSYVFWIVLQAQAGLAFAIGFVGSIWGFIDFNAAMALSFVLGFIISGLLLIVGSSTLPRWKLSVKRPIVKRNRGELERRHLSDLQHGLVGRYPGDELGRNR